MATGVLAEKMEYQTGLEGSIRAVLNKHDPLGLHEMYQSKTEYDWEVSAIAGKISKEISFDDLYALIYSVFRWPYQDDKLQVTSQHITYIASQQGTLHIISHHITNIPVYQSISTELYALLKDQNK